MRYLIHAPNRLVAVGIVPASIAIAVMMIVVVRRILLAEAATFSCAGVQIDPGDDPDAIVNNDSADGPTTFCVHASSSGATYKINHTVLLKEGDKLLGRPGQLRRAGRLQTQRGFPRQAHRASRFEPAQVARYSGRRGQVRPQRLGDPEQRVGDTRGSG